MNGDKYISDDKLDEIRKEYGKRLAAFSDARQQVERWYQYFGISYPSSSINNYRDSWFHYRKIWTERSFYEVTCQMATFDEHLQRAEKDAIVNFFQIISQELEFWYHIDQKCIPEDFILQIQECVDSFYSSRCAEVENQLWLEKIWQYYEEREQEASFALLYAAKNCILNTELKKHQIQKILHRIKNVTLQIRFGASDIQRIEYPGEYVERYRRDYMDLQTFFQEEENRELYFLLGMTKLVIANIESYQIENKMLKLKET